MPDSLKNQAFFVTLEKLKHNYKTQFCKSKVVKLLIL